MEEHRCVECIGLVELGDGKTLCAILSERGCIKWVDRDRLVCGAFRGVTIDESARIEQDTEEV